MRFFGTAQRSHSPVARWLLVFGVGIGACATTSEALRDDMEAPAAPLLIASPDRGRAVYRKACMGCHGTRGDGQGPGAAGLTPEPRDFTRAVYRYRSTPSGSLPRTEDLVRTVRMGLPGTTMPAFRDHLSPQDIVDVVATVQAFGARFTEEEPDEPIVIPALPDYSAESTARGRVVYERVQCGKCHGKDGEGDGWAREDEMKDPLGRVVRARDFTKGIYQGGDTREDIYRTFVTGLDGTPMPAYEGSAAPEEIGDLVNYLLSLEQDRDAWYWLTTPPRWYEPGEHEVPR